MVAGIGALGRADFPAAVGLLQRGVDLLPPDDPRGLEARLDLALALVRRGELERAEKLLRATIDEAGEVGNEQRRSSRARIAYNRLRSRIDPESPMEAELEAAIEIASSLERTGDLANLARAYTEIGMCRFMLGQAGDGDADLRRAADLARQAGSGALEREALMTRLRPIAWGPTPAEEGIAFCTTLLESETTNAAERAHACQVRGLCAALQGDGVEARSSSARCAGR